MLCLIITPYQLCFERSNSGPFSPIESLNLAMDMCFLADFLITFQTGIVVQGGVVESRYVIAKTGVPRRVSRDRGHDEPSSPTRSVGQDLPQGLRGHRPARERALQGRKRVIQCRFNVSVSRSRVSETAPTLRERSER